MTSLLTWALPPKRVSSHCFASKKRKWNPQKNYPHSLPLFEAYCYKNEELRLQQHYKVTLKKLRLKGISVDHYHPVYGLFIKLKGPICEITRVTFDLEPGAKKYVVCNTVISLSSKRLQNFFVHRGNISERSKCELL